AAARLSEGVLHNPYKVEVTRQGRLVAVATESRMGRLAQINESWDDELVVCAYHPELRVAGVNEVPCIRQEGVVSIQLPPLLADKPVHLYLLVHRSRRTEMVEQ